MGIGACLVLPLVPLIAWFDSAEEFIVCQRDNKHQDTFFIYQRHNIFFCTVESCDQPKERWNDRTIERSNMCAFLAVDRIDLAFCTIPIYGNKMTI